MQDYEAIRERIARWLGWRDIQREAYTPTGKAMCGTRPDGEPGIWGTHRGYCPDPLKHVTDAWALQCALIDKGFEFCISRTCAGYAVEWFNPAFNHQPIWCKTPAEALVMAWAQAFPAEEGE